MGGGRCMKHNINVRNYISCLFKSISAGIMIGISGYIYLNCDNKYIGSILFCIGLITICVYSLNLYTGQVGYLIKARHKRKYAMRLLVTLLGNIVGCWAIAQFPIPQPAMNKLQEIIQVKSIYTALPKSLLCGCMMFLAVDIYKTKGTYISIFLCVTGFILSGMEHSIANSYYLFLLPNKEFLISMPIYIIGNAIGAILICLVTSIAKVNKKENYNASNNRQ